MSVLLSNKTKVDEEKSIKPPNLEGSCAPSATLEVEGLWFTSLDKMPRPVPEYLTASIPLIKRSRNVFNSEKAAIQGARKFRIAEIDRLQAEVNALDQRIAEIEVEEQG